LSGKGWSFRAQGFTGSAVLIVHTTEERTMELIMSDAESVTIKLNRPDEFAPLLDILRTISLELEAGRIDLERLMSSEIKVESLVNSFFELTERI
jgi:hypothetical protein